MHASQVYSGLHAACPCPFSSMALERSRPRWEGNSACETAPWGIVYPCVCAMHVFSMQRGLRKQAMEMKKALDLLKEEDRKPDATADEERENAELFLFTEVRCAPPGTTGWHAYYSPHLLTRVHPQLTT